MKKSYSLTNRLVTAVLLVQMISAVLITGLAVAYERHTHFHAFDIMVRGRADSLLGAVQDAEDPADNVMLDGTEVNLPTEDIYEVMDENNRLLGRSANWAGSGTVQENSKKGDFFKLRLKGKSYRVLKIGGLRMVDPGDKGGGIPRHVTVIYGAPTDSVWKAVWQTVAFYALTSLALLVISGLLMSWLLKRGLAPLRELAAEAANVSVHSWDFTPSEEARKTKELAPLISALENVLGGLERSFLQQRQFVSDAAHELKTAVAVVKSSLQLLMMKRRTVPEYEAGLDRSYLDSERMEEIVARMLTLARIEDKQQVEADLYSTDMAQSAKLVAEQFEPMAQVKNLMMTVCSDENAMVNVEKEELQLLCSNLISNAIQHSSPGSGIRITVKKRETMVELCIEDHGNGIEFDALPHVFDRFYRGDRSRNRATGGTGLGLSICKAIVTKFEGEISIASAIDTGTTVKVLFRIATV